MKMQRCARILSLLLVGSLASSIVSADETCGLPSTFDVIFIDGFDGAAATALAKPTVAQLEQRRRARVLTAPTIAITYPASGATIADTRTDIVGTYTGPDDTGIAIGSAVAYVHNGQFVIPAFPLASGSNTLTAVATTLDGQTASASVGVSGASTPPALTLSANALAGFSPFTITFRSSFHGGSIQSVAVDYDGNGTDDYTGSTLPSPFSHTYNSPGIYPVRLTFHAVGGSVYTATQRVVIQDLEAVKTTVCGVFGHFRENLAANQITTATQALGAAAKERYTPFLNGLGATNAAQVATQLGTIANGIFGVDTTSLIVVATENSELLGFTVGINRGDDGVWRITDL
jgi:PKD repeat protein